jgi:hypothetical protein
MQINHLATMCVLNFFPKMFHQMDTWTRGNRGTSRPTPRRLKVHRETVVNLFKKYYCGQCLYFHIQHTNNAY